MGCQAVTGSKSGGGGADSGVLTRSADSGRERSGPSSCGQGRGARGQLAGGVVRMRIRARDGPTKPMPDGEPQIGAWSVSPLLRGSAPVTSYMSL